MKILALSSIRSEYFLIRRLLIQLNHDPDIDLKLLVGGAHLSDRYGRTVDHIKSDGLEILLQAESLLDSDSKLSRVKSAGILLISAIDTISAFSPDLILYAGDREEVLIGGMIGAYLEIPTMHIYGGDHTQDGHVDNPVRHATSKLSTISIVACQQHAERLKALGESNSRIFNVGSIALDRFRHVSPIPFAALKSNLKIEAEFTHFAILIFHPISDDEGPSDKIFKNILESLMKKKIFTFVSSPNSDPGNRSLLKIADNYKNEDQFYFYKNLNDEEFATLYRHSAFIIGNSSSGILEAASFQKPAINVGQRQRGRMCGANVIWSSAKSHSITASIDKALSREFTDSLTNLENPYGSGHSVERLIKIIKTVPFKNLVLKKEDPLEGIKLNNLD